MDYTIKKNGFDVVTLSINRSGKFYRKPVIETHREAMATLRFEPKDIAMTYSAKHYFVLSCVQCFFTWFIFAITIHKEQLSESTMMNYGDTINAELENISQP